MSEIIKDQNVVSSFKKDIQLYSIESNLRRSIPDWRDGLKFVQRKTLYSMSTLNGMNELSKTARVVGDTIGKYHPHGDTSVQDAITIMATWWNTKMPLIYSESNMGSMQGDGAAAMRYTEVMLSSFANDVIFNNLKGTKEVVDWLPTFDNKSKEPEYLPVSVPLLLINGTFGMGVGIKVEIPKHNLGEVIDATVNLIRNPDAPVVLIPDHCMPCEIIDTNWKSICNKGNGKYIVRGVIDIEHWKNHDVLVIKSIPDRVKWDKGGSTQGGILYDILKDIEEKKITQITKYQEDSHGSDLRILFHLKPGADANYVRDVLYKETSLQDTYSVNFEVLDGIKLVRMSYKSYLQAFIEESKMRKFRYYCIKLQQVRTEKHQVDAFIKCIESGQVDTIIRMIRKFNNENENELIEFLIKKIGLTDIQAEFIINSTIKHLSIYHLNRYKERLKKDDDLEKEYLMKISDDNILLEEIIDELLEIKKKYNTPRRCKVIKKEDITKIPQGEFNLVITENNYIKKLSPNDNIGSYHNDNPKFITKVQNTENVLLFTAQGKVFKLPVHKIPITDKGSVGFDIRMIIKGLVSDIIAVIYEPMLIEASKQIEPQTQSQLLILTAGNCIKRLCISDFLTVPPSGIFYTRLNDGDMVVDVKMVPINIPLDVVIYSGRKALRFSLNDVPVLYRRNTLGVIGMKLHEGEIIDGMSVISQEATDIVVITESGKANRFNVSGLPTMTRNRAGSSVIKLGKNDQIKFIAATTDKDSIMIKTNNNMLEVLVKDIPIGSSISAGKKITTGKDIVIKCKLL